MDRQQLTAILTATRSDALYLDDGSYLDWSSGGLEVGDAQGRTVQLDMGRVELEQLLHRLAATLLAGE